jgi:hypothetical protein
MIPGYGRLHRICALFLLVLAASPLTAPFSSGHSLDLLDDSIAHVQSKKAPDEPVVSLPGPLAGDWARGWNNHGPARPVAGKARGVDALQRPLRL